jgi:serine/threonine-protein kinase RsbW
MFMGKKHVLTVPGLYDEVKTICQFVTQGAAAAGMGKTAVFHIELACDEACTNVIEHAYRGESGGNITVSWQIIDDIFVITVNDNGRRFEPGQIPTPPVADNIEEIKIGGLGIHFMRKLMDDVSFSFDPQSGNELIMKKKIKAEAS